jgi:hypothetical protein
LPPIGFGDIGRVVELKRGSVRRNFAEGHRARRILSIPRTRRCASASGCPSEA